MKGYLSFALSASILGFLLISSSAYCEERGVFGIAPGAETGGYFSQLFPLLKEAGVNAVRGFPTHGRRSNQDRMSGTLNSPMPG